eukprot:6485558-Amphidinium_carterae.2
MVKGPIRQIRQVIVSGTAGYPFTWTDDEIAHHLAGVYAVPVDTVKRMKAKRTGPCEQVFGIVKATFPQTIIQGGGRVQRVQQHSLEHAVVHKLTQDLQDHHIPVSIEQRLIEHLAHADAKFVRCAFQANSVRQRLAAFAAALERAGIVEYASVLKKSADALKSTNADQSDSFAPASGTDESESARTTPPARAAPLGQSSAVRTAMESRLKALEIWAHAVDAADNPTSEQSPAAVQRYLDEKFAQIKEAADMEREEDRLRFARQPCRPSIRPSLQRYARPAGQEEYATGMEKADVNYPGYSDVHTSETRQGSGLAVASAQLSDSQCTDLATTDPYLTTGSRKRGRPPNASKVKEDDSQRHSGTSTQSSSLPTSQLAVLTEKCDALQLRLKKLEQHTAGAYRSQNAYSQETIDYAASDPPNSSGELQAQPQHVTWEDKLDHMDSYLAELGSISLRLMDDMKHVKMILGMTGQEPSTTGNMSIISTTQALQRCEDKCDTLARKLDAGDNVADIDTLRALQIKVERLTVELANCSRLVQFSWSCSQNMAVRLQLVHDTSSLALQQLARLRAMICPGIY